MTNLNVSVYYAKISDTWFIEGYKDYITWLNIEDFKRFNMMKSVLKRNQFLLSRILIQKIARLITNETTIHYQVNHYSELVINDKYLFSISISHSGDVAAICICDKTLQIGIDVEKVKKRNLLALANEFCTHEELFFLNTSSNKTTDFYKLWTAKEALTKATKSSLYEIYSCNCSEVIDHVRGSLLWNSECFIFSNIEIFKNQPVTYIGSVITTLESEEKSIVNNKSFINILWIYYTT